MFRIIVVIMLLLLLPGCATLTAAGIAAAVSIGAAQGAGKFAAQKAAEKFYRENYNTRHIAWRQCHRIRERNALERCLLRYIPT